MNVWGFVGVFFPAWCIESLSGSNESGIDTKLGCYRIAAVAGEYVNHQASCSIPVVQVSLHLVAAQGERRMPQPLCLWEVLEALSCSKLIIFSCISFLCGLYVCLLQQSIETEIVIGVVNIWDASWSFHCALCTPVSLYLCVTIQFLVWSSPPNPPKNPKNPSPSIFVCYSVLAGKANIVIITV